MDARGTPWWRVQNQRLHAAGIVQLWVVSSVTVTGIEQHVDCVVVPDDKTQPSLPMFASIFAGLVAISHRLPEHVFILPVDTPVPSREVFRGLAAKAEAGCAIPVHFGARGHPVCLGRRFIEQKILAVPTLDPLTTRLDSLTREDAICVDVYDSNTIFNINTPEALEHWLDSQPDP
jgi:CTP:molybdopterin cytidylyltransferase MocA